MGRFQSGQMDQTVNLLSYDFGGSNPPLPTMQLAVNSWQQAVKNCKRLTGNRKLKKRK